MDTIDSVILDGIEIQANGIIRNSEGHLIGRLVDKIDFNDVHIQKFKRLPLPPQP